MPTPAATDDRWERGDPYESYVGRWSRLVASRFLSWLGMPAGLRWLDVGCGTGALAATIVANAAPASVIGVEPSEGFLATATRRLGGQAQLHRGSANALPLPDSAVDIAMSGLVLNFVPDPAAALAQMPAYAMALDEAARTRLRERLRAQLPTAADGSIALVAQAWAARAVSPGPG